MPRKIYGSSRRFLNQSHVGEPGVHGGGRGRGNHPGRPGHPGRSGVPGGIQLAQAIGAASGQSIPSVDVAALTKICDLLLAAPQASFDTNTILGGNIPGSYAHLFVVLSGRVTTAAQNDPVDLIINNDTSGSHYDIQWLVGNSASTASTAQGLAANLGQMNVFPGASATAGYAGSSTMFIPNYADTTLHKSVTYEMFAPFSSMWRNAGAIAWHQTAAITRLTFNVHTGGQNFVAGSRFTLYGLS